MSELTRCPWSDGDTKMIKHHELVIACGSKHYSNRSRNIWSLTLCRATYPK